MPDLTSNSGDHKEFVRVIDPQVGQPDSTLRELPFLRVQTLVNNLAISYNHGGFIEIATTAQ